MSECICPCLCGKEMTARDVRMNMARCPQCRNGRTPRCKRTYMSTARNTGEESVEHVEKLFAMQKARGRKWTGVSA